MWFIGVEVDKRRVHPLLRKILSMEPWNEKSQIAQEGVTNGLCEHFEHRDFFASTRTDKKFALREASSLESTTREQRPLLIFSACSNPYANPFL